MNITPTPEFMEAVSNVLGISEPKIEAAHAAILKWGEVPTNDARFEHLVALKVQYEEQARSSRGRSRQKLEKMAAAYNDMALEELKKAAANRGPEV
jgi:hypothetical protein